MSAGIRLHCITKRMRFSLALCLTYGCLAQTIEVREAPLLTMPARVDSNSPAFWLNGQFHLLNSTGGEAPVLSSGTDQFRLRSNTRVRLAKQQIWPMWIEAVWVDPTGVVLGWYHQEHEWLCGAQRPAQPHIGAAISHDGGKTFFDSGVVLSSPDPVRCSSMNGYFAGGHGDFSVILDRDRKFFYFLFSNYGGVVQSQGVSIARMAYGDRFKPVGNVWKYRGGSWHEPGVGGRSTPIFPAAVGWQREETDSFWGPSVHWNSYLEKFVVLMNRSCCSSGFPQEGIYASFNADIGDPAGWSKPTKILDDTGWYPQVLGMGRAGTDRVAGEQARLYIYGESRWRLVFRKSAE